MRMPKEAGFTFALTGGKGPQCHSCWLDGEEKEEGMSGIEKELEYPSSFPRWEESWSALMASLVLSVFIQS